MHLQPMHQACLLSIAISASIVVSSLIQGLATGPTSGDLGERVDLLIHMQDTDCTDKL